MKSHWHPFILGYLMSAASQAPGATLVLGDGATLLDRGHFSLKTADGVTLKVTVEQVEDDPEKQLGDIAERLLANMSPEDADAAIDKMRARLAEREKRQG